jgi:HEPN domain
VLTWHDVPFRKTHSLEELGRQVVELHGELRSLADRVSLLSEYAWKFRYPGAVDAPAPTEATDALALAREAHATVVAAIGERLF